MRTVYETASAVLIRDAELKTASRYSPPEELMARVCISPWCGRLWTLQEAVLNDKVFVQLSHHEVALLDDLNQPVHSLVLLSDELLDAEPGDATDPFSAASDNENQDFRQPVDFATKFSACPSTILSMNVLPISRSSNPYRTKAELFFEILTKVRCRETSRTSDEAVCLTTLLDEGIEDVLWEDNANSRWIGFLSTIEDVISPGIIFCNLPKMDIPGYGWAPRSFLPSTGEPELTRIINMQNSGQGMYDFREEDSDLDKASSPPTHGSSSLPARISKRGFIVSFPGFTFLPLVNPLPPEFTFTCNTDDVTHRCITEHCPGLFEAYFDGTASQPEKPWDAVKPGEHSTISVVLENAFTDPTAPVRGVLLKDCSQEENVLHGAYVCLVLVLRNAGGFASAKQEDMRQKMLQSVGKTQSELVKGASLIREQEWCIR